MNAPKLFEISCLIHRTVVILATSEKEALSHVETWEEAWASHGDLVGVSDVEVSTIRDLKVPLKDWEDEAHDITTEVRSLIPSEQG